MTVSLYQGAEFSVGTNEFSVCTYANLDDFVKYVNVWQNEGSCHPLIQGLSVNEIVDVSLSVAYTEADIRCVASVCLSPSCADFCDQASLVQGAKVEEYGGR